MYGLFVCHFGSILSKHICFFGEIGCPHPAEVHLTGGSLRVFKHFAWLEVDSGKAALSPPAHQQVTHTVRVDIEKCTPIGLDPQAARFLVQVLLR